MTHVISHWLQQKFHPFRDFGWVCEAWISGCEAVRLQELDYILLHHCKMALPFETPILDWIRRKSCRLKGLVKAFASWSLVEIYGMMRFSLTTWSHTKWKLIAMYFIFEWKEIDRKVGSMNVITIYNKCLRELKAKFTQKRFEPKDFGNCVSKGLIYKLRGRLSNRHLLANQEITLPPKWLIQII